MFKHSVHSESTHFQPSIDNNESLLLDFAAFLQARGHQARTSKAYLESVIHFIRWLDESSVHNAISPAAAREFLQSHLPVCHCLSPAPKCLKSVRAAVNQLLLMSGYDRLVQPTHQARVDLEACITQYDNYLHSICGLAPSTRWYRCRFSRDFLESQFSHQPLEFARITPDVLVSYIADKAANLRPSSTAILVGSLRSYLRFLQFTGQIAHRMGDMLTGPANLSLSALPASLSENDLAQFNAAFNRATSIGKRDYAIARCLMDMALRCHEVANMQLDDIDWRSGLLHFPKTKSRRGDSLPLPASAGQALTDYLRFGRPACRSRAVFVYHHAPTGKALAKTAVRGAIRRAFKRAGLPWSGTHVLRHTAATQMLQAGNSIKDIADVLRHRSIDTTMIYTKVDQPNLQTVALAWPEDQS